MSHGASDQAALGSGEQAPQAESETGFRCHICQEPSEEICKRCTRDACPNHLCEKCKRCSDCCECG